MGDIEIWLVEMKQYKIRPNFLAEGSTLLAAGKAGPVNVINKAGWIGAAFLSTVFPIWICNFILMLCKLIKLLDDARDESVTAAAKIAALDVTQGLGLRL